MKNKKTLKRRQLKKRGGAKIGEGTYGFVVKPAIPCVGKNVSRKISKVFKKKLNLSANRQKNYINFKNRRKMLEPIIERLKEIDPEKKYFLYPEFCDLPGELTEELRANGVTNNMKSNSYLMNMGGKSVSDVMNTFLSLINILYYTKLSTDEEKEKEIKQLLRNNIYKLLFPIAKKIYTALTILHEAGILHNDIHSGNIVLEFDHKGKAFLEKVDVFINVIKENSKNNSNKFLYLISYQKQFENIYNFIKSLSENDLSGVEVRIIDFDNATLDKDIDEDSASNETFEAISSILQLSVHYDRFFNEI